MRQRRPFHEHLKHITPDENGCWPWPGVIESNGYGRASFHNRRWWAHRASYAYHHGRIPDGAVICHKCDVRHCVNPNHLFAGSVADNQRDMMLKGRTCHGGRVHNSKLTEEAVRSIRADTRPGWQIAAAHGVSQGTISEVRSRKLWRHVA